MTCLYLGTQNPQSRVTLDSFHTPGKTKECHHGGLGALSWPHSGHGCTMQEVGSTAGCSDKLNH